MAESYSYDDLGLRIRIVDSTGKTSYNIYDEARHLVAQYDKPSGGSLRWKADMLYSGDKELAEVDNCGTMVTLTDHLGTPRFAWRGAGDPLFRQKFMPFGENLTDPQIQAALSKGFTNHEQTDASGLIYMQARIYLPMYGRFASPDPARDQHYEETQSWNIYSYVRNNPVVMVDPTGLEKLDRKAPDGSEWAQPTRLQTLSAETANAQSGTPLPALPATPSLDSTPLPSLPPTNPVTNAPGVPPAGELGSLGNVPIGGWHTLRPNGTTHAGADLAAPLMTPIFAPISGNVLFSGFKNSIAGGTVTISDPHSNTQVSAKHMLVDFGMCSFSLSGGLTYSFHSGTGFVKTGQYVQQGQQIGVQGNTGNASWTNSAPSRQHVHFEVHVNGRSVDPVRWLNGVPQ